MNRRDLTLARLRAVRAVRAHASGRQLGMVAQLLGKLRATGNRIEQLRDDLELPATKVDAYRAKAVAAARDALDAATRRQQARIAETEARRTTAATRALGDQARTDAVDRAIERNRIAEASAVRLSGGDR